MNDPAVTVKKQPGGCVCIVGRFHECGPSDQQTSQFRATDTLPPINRITTFGTSLPQAKDNTAPANRERLITRIGTAFLIFCALLAIVAIMAKYQVGIPLW